MYDPGKNPIGSTAEQLVDEWIQNLKENVRTVIVNHMDIYGGRTSPELGRRKEKKGSLRVRLISTRKGVVSASTQREAWLPRPQSPLSFLLGTETAGVDRRPQEPRVSW